MSHTPAPPKWSDGVTVRIGPIPASQFLRLARVLRNDALDRFSPDMPSHRPSPPAMAPGTKVRLSGGQLRRYLSYVSWSAFTARSFTGQAHGPQGRGRES